VPVHVFGNPCDTQKIDSFAQKNRLKVIYDASHSFGVKDNLGQSILNHGDISTLSFHATKMFHTVEGGAIVTSNSDLAAKIRLLIKCGIPGADEVSCVGINAKMNEFSAAMGLCVLDDINYIQQERKRIWEQYIDGLTGFVKFQYWPSNYENNYAYFPVIFDSEKDLIASKTRLESNNIFPRRYFYPSLDTLDFLSTSHQCCNSRDIAQRIMCLPIYPGLTDGEIQSVITIIRSSV
jgi:dTDP-4-amino-4,6-dideoxygalactose transaminase